MQLIDNNDISSSILLSLQLRRISVPPSIHDYSTGRSLSAGAGLFLYPCLSPFFRTVIYTRWLQSSYLWETVEIAETSQELINEPGAVVYCFLPNNKGLIIIAMITIIAWRNKKRFKKKRGTFLFFLKSPGGSKLIVEDGFDPSPSGLWAQRASAAPLGWVRVLSPQSPA